MAVTSQLPDEIASDTSSAGAISRPATGAALADLRREFGDQWQITAIPGGYRATPRQTHRRPGAPRYGRTPAELAESIRMTAHQP